MNANDYFKGYNCTESYYKHLSGLVYTDGVRALCIECASYWMIDVIGSYRYKLKQHEFQVWKLTKNTDDTAVITCEDGNDNIILSQRIEYTDFKYDTATIWVENNVILLPSEH